MNDSHLHRDDPRTCGEGVLDDGRHILRLAEDLQIINRLSMRFERGRLKLGRFPDARFGRSTVQPTLTCCHPRVKLFMGYQQTASANGVRDELRASGQPARLDSHKDDGATCTGLYCNLDFDI